MSDPIRFDTLPHVQPNGTPLNKTPTNAYSTNPFRKNHDTAFIETDIAESEQFSKPPLDTAPSPLQSYSHADNQQSTMPLGPHNDSPSQPTDFQPFRVQNNSVNRSDPPSHSFLHDPLTGHSTDVTFSHVDLSQQTNSFSSSSNVDSFSKRASIGLKHKAKLDSIDQEDEVYSPIGTETYPPTTGEDVEVKRVQQNLERWTAEERRRRKAARSSRPVSVSGPPSGPTGLARKLSSLRPSKGGRNPLGLGPSSEHLAERSFHSPTLPYSPTLAKTFDRPTRPASASYTQQRTGGGRTESLSSFDSANTDPSSTTKGSLTNGKPNAYSSNGRASDSPSLPNVPKTDTETSGKGKNTKINNPFQDPQHTNPSFDSYTYSSDKPRPTSIKPIVTVGRASSIQRRAIEAGMANRSYSKGPSMPSIIATDTEMEQDPFHSAEDGQIGSSSRSASTTLHQGGLDEEVAIELNRSSSSHTPVVLDQPFNQHVSSTSPMPQPSRMSTSSSKFRELGITAGDDWIHSMHSTAHGDDQASSSAKRKSINVRPHTKEEDEIPRQHWWTEFFCCCGQAYDEDEQAGRTNPME